MATPAEPVRDCSASGHESLSPDEHLQLQATILAHITHSVIVTDLRGSITYWNEGAQVLFGYSSQEMLGKTPALLYPEQDAQQLTHDLQQILEGQDYAGEWKGRRKDGATVWVAIKTSLLRSATNEVLGFIGMAADITERKQAEGRLKASEERLRALLEHSADAISLLDRAGRRLYSSPASARILGYEPGSLLGQEPFGYVHPDDVSHVRHLLTALLQQPGVSLPAQFRVRHRDGSWVWIEGTGTNLLEHTSVRAIVVNYRDITQRKRAQQQSEYLALLSEQISDAVISIDPDFLIRSWNRGAERIYGWQAQEVLGKRLQDIIPVTYLTGSRDDYQQALATAGFWKGEVQQYCKDGTPLVLLGTASVLKDHDGAVLGTVAVNRDLSERKHLEEQLRASEARFRSLIEHGADVIVLTDAQGTNHYASPSITRVLGYSVEDYLAERGLERVHPEDRARVRDDFLSLLARPGAAVKGQLRYRHQDGSWRWLESTTTNWLHEPSIGAVVSNFRDITAQREGREAQRRLAAIVESSADAIISKDLEGVITDWNAAAERLFGYPAAEAIGQSIRLIIPAGLQAEEDAIIGQLLAGRVIKQYETMRRRKDGSLVPVSLSISPIRDGEGTIIGAAKIARDISERREQEQLKDLFLALAGHELKTPLTGLKGFLDLLIRHLQRRQDEEGLSLLKRATQQVERMSRLIADFLDIAKMQAGKLDYHEEAVALDDLVREIVETVQEGSPRHRLVVEGRTGAKVFADRERIVQVLSNLLTNAVRYSPDAQTVIVRLSRDQHNVCVSVQDFGIGISQVEQGRIFDRYYQAGGARQRPSGGLGLGLYLSREIITHHQGAIRVESTPGQGATFSFSLPLLSEEKEGDERAEESNGR